MQDSQGFDFGSDSAELKDKSAPLKCESCNKQFAKSEKKLFDLHKNHKQCSWCKKFFGCNKNLQTHKSFECSAKAAEINKGGKLSTNKCRKCAKSFKSLKGLSNHYSGTLVCNAASSGKFKCDFCEMRFYNENHLSYHKGLSHCKKCYLDFSCIGQLKEHRKKAGCGEINSQNAEGGGEMNKETVMTCKLCSKNYKSSKCHFFRVFNKICRVCRKEFECRGLCKNHEKSCEIVSSQQVVIEEQRMEVDENPMAPRQPPIKVRKCAHCEFLCTSEETFQNHTNPTKCPRCGFLQPCNKRLALHLDSCRFQVAAEPAFKCPMCGQGFAEAALLGSHIGTCVPGGFKSPDYNEFKCKECGKIFQMESKLRYHEERRHLSQKLKNEMQMLVEDHRKLKEAFSLELVAKHIVKKEAIDIITLDD